MSDFTFDDCCSPPVGSYWIVEGDEFVCDGGRTVFECCDYPLVVWVCNDGCLSDDGVELGDADTVLESGESASLTDTELE